ncbi:YcaO-like family protein [Streptomyces sp. CRN 30]|uniref:YcaO-like family protein n=1 Tax=Streptomyces sp. CRN 30 TaxID=3075613 RepID=UPI002A7F6014|nr:YcaO-like family protein [Streptomyces sp. CRN 30]
MSTDLLHLDGTVRARDPEDTWRALVPRLADYGITRVADLTGLDHLGLPVWVAHRPTAAALTVSQGRGATSRLAAVAAAMEAVERWHAEQQPTVDVHGNAGEIGLDHPLDALPLRVPPQSMRDLRGLGRVPQDWTAGQGLLTGRLLHVPSGLVSRAPGPLWAPGLWRATSTGLACGNTWHEAVAHGLFEVIERHALHVDEQAGGHLRTPVDPDSVESPYARRLVDRLDDRGALVRLYSVGNAFGLPVCLAGVWSEDYPAWFVGAGCHLDPHIALTRALTEAAQARLTSIAGLRDDLPSRAVFTDPQPADPPSREQPSNWTALLRTWPTPADYTLADLVRTAAERLRRVTTYEPVAVTLSRPDAPVDAVKVVAPGARGGARD